MVCKYYRTCRNTMHERLFCLKLSESPVPSEVIMFRETRDWFSCGDVALLRLDWGKPDDVRN